jgi:hypothetical protein
MARKNYADLTTREVAEGEEIGVAAHGPAAAGLGGDLAEPARTWHAGPRRHEPTITVTRSGSTVTSTVRWQTP